MSLKDFGFILNTIGGLLLISGYIPNAYRLFKAKDPGNNSPQYWVIMTFGIFCVGINQAVRGVPTVQLITQWCNITLAFTCTILVLYYGNKKKKNISNQN